MAMQSVTLQLPELLYEKVRDLARHTAQPVESVLLHQLETAFLPSLPTLPPDEESELASLQYLSDDALWTIARDQLPASIKETMEALMQKHSRGSITTGEHQQLSDLVDRSERLMLRKSEAAALLTARGYTVTTSDLANRD